MVHHLGNSRDKGFLDGPRDALELLHGPVKVGFIDADIKHVSSRCGTG